MACLPARWAWRWQVLEDVEVIEHTKGFVSDVVADDTVQRTGRRHTPTHPASTQARPARNRREVSGAIC